MRAGTALWADLDCRLSIPWREQLRTIEEAWNVAGLVLPRLLMVDHAADLGLEEVAALCLSVSAPRPQPIHATLWVGSIDVRAIHQQHAVRVHGTPRSHFAVPDLAPDDLLQVYRAIANASECEWGESMLHFLLDWCGDDLALVASATQYFYGNWRINMHDSTVADCLSRWLAEDALVEKYRQGLRDLSEPSKAQLRVMSIGGKLLCRRREIDQEPDDIVRRLFLQGILASNLLPGYYQFRNLTIRYLWSDHEGFRKPVSAISLLRRSANARVNQLLQDIEWSLRLLVGKVFENLGLAETKRRLQKIRVAERSITPQLSVNLQNKAETQGGAPLVEAMNKILAQCRLEADAVEHLWAKVSGLYRKEMVVSDQSVEPPISEIPDYMTLNELSSLILSWKEDVFVAVTSRGETLPAADRWKEYLARIQRLRNQTAHLRNVGFQDLEDLLANARAMRNDFLSMLCVLKTPATEPSGGPSAP